LVTNEQSIDECIDEYINLSRQVFDVDQVLKGVIPIGDNQCRFDYKQLEGAIKYIVAKKLGNDNEPMASSDSNGTRNVPTFVVATKGLRAEGPPTLFRSYQCQGHDANQCAIWEAGRATSAAPTFFAPIEIAIPKPGCTFVDGGLGHNNPAELALSEAEKIWPKASRFCLVSVGTGRPGSIRVAESTSLASKPKMSGIISNALALIPGVASVTKYSKIATRTPGGLIAMKNIAEACVQLATSSDPVHRRLFQQSQSPDLQKKFPYHRFNVDRDMQDIGLEEWGKMKEIRTHTDAYMEEGEGVLRKNNCVQDLMNLQPMECK